MPASPPLPKNWPAHFPYLTSSTHSKTLNPTHLLSIRTRHTDASIPSIPASTTTPRGPSPLVKITPITDPSHPANTQSGLFATRDLKPGTFILQYLGEVHAEGGGAHESSDYDLSLDRYLALGIDAHAAGNEARFINDYRGVAERPNAEFRECWDEVRGERGMGVWVLGEGKGSGKGKNGKGKAAGTGREKGIRKGEEILVSYGRGFWGARVEGGEG